MGTEAALRQSVSCERYELKPETSGSRESARAKAYILSGGGEGGFKDAEDVGEKGR